MFLDSIKHKVGKYYANSILECKLIKRKKLYGFDCEKEYKFVYLKFKNMAVLNKVKNLWYEENTNTYGTAPVLDDKDKEKGNKWNTRKLLKNGLEYRGESTYIYESNIPPLLRFLHIQNISPSGSVFSFAIF